MIEYHQKNVWLKEKSAKTKNYLITYTRYTTLKNHFLLFTLGCVAVTRRSKLKLWSTISILKLWHIEFFLLQKENDCKVQLRFVKYCILVVTERYHILLSPLNRLVTHHFIMSRMYTIRTSWEHNQVKKSVVSIKGAVGSEPFSRGFRGQSLQRFFLGSKEYLDWLNDTHRENFFLLNSVQEFIEIQAGCSRPFSYIYTINQFPYIILPHN